MITVINMYQPELPFGSGFPVDSYFSRARKPKAKRKTKKRVMSFSQARRFIKNSQTKLLKREMWLGDICKRTGLSPSTIKRAVKGCGLLIDGCLDWHDDDEVVLYLIDWQDEIKSGTHTMPMMEEDTLRKRNHIKAIAIENNLAYKKEEKQSYFSVPLGPWNRPLGKCL